MGRLFASEEYRPELYLTEWAKKNYAPLYEMVIRFLPSPDKLGRLADLGCGVGHVAKAMKDNGYNAGQYMGVDFSEAAIALAKGFVPGFTFFVGDIFDQDVQEAVYGCDAFLLLEILEHLRDDIAAVEFIPSGKLVILSVPNYNSKAHVRKFKNAVEVTGRYGGMLSFKASGIIKVNNRKRIFVFMAKRI